MTASTYTVLDRLVAVDKVTIAAPWVAERSRVVAGDDFLVAVGVDGYSPTHAKAIVDMRNALPALIMAARVLKEMSEFWAYGLAKPDGAELTNEDQARVEAIAKGAAEALAPLLAEAT